MSVEPKVISGGCLCRTVRYEMTGSPYDITHCHCSDCRKSSGAPFVTWATFRRANFRFTRGQPKELHWAGRLRAFCPQCGTPLTFMAEANAEEIDITVCSFDDPATITPADHTWTEDRLPWIQLADNLRTYKRSRESHS